MSLQNLAKFTKVSFRTIYNFLNDESTKKGIGVKVLRRLASKEDKLIIDAVIRRTKNRCRRFKN